MRMTYLLPALMSAALVLPATAALAQQAAPAPAATEESGGTAPAAKPQKEKKVCRAQPGSFSHMMTRTCKTRAEWEQLDRSTNSQRAPGTNIR